jgi:hypothetical protein
VTQAQDRLGELVVGAKRRADRPGDSAADLAESFRNASKALEAVTRDLVALRHRVTKPPSR